MENLSNVDEQNEQLHPKPNEDPGAKIETVTPEPKKEHLPNDKSNAPENTKDKSETDSDDKEHTAPKARENKGSDHTEIETVTPDE